MAYFRIDGESGASDDLTMLGELAWKRSLLAEIRRLVDKRGNDKARDTLAMFIGDIDGAMRCFGLSFFAERFHAVKRDTNTHIFYLAERRKYLKNALRAAQEIMDGGAACAIKDSLIVNGRNICDSLSAYRPIVHAAKIENP